MTDLEPYEVFALHYASKENRQRHENFVSADPHDGPMPLDYYVWVIRNSERTIVVDTGFNETDAKTRGRTLYRLPRTALAALDIDCEEVKTVILTHLHYDHAGTLSEFENARFHIQDAEVHFATGRHMTKHVFSHSYTVDHVCELIKRVYGNRVDFHDGDADIAPGVSVHKIGGHTPGLQSVRVFTERGWVVLASDAVHFYENIDKTSPFPLVTSVTEMVSGYDRLRELATSDDHIIPGHDPLVKAKYSAIDGPNGFTYQLHVAPTESELASG